MLGQPGRRGVGPYGIGRGQVAFIRPWRLPPRGMRALLEAPLRCWAMAGAVHPGLVGGDTWSGGTHSASDTPRSMSGMWSQCPWGSPALRRAEPFLRRAGPMCPAFQRGVIGTVLLVADGLGFGCRGRALLRPCGLPKRWANSPILYRNGSSCRRAIRESPLRGRVHFRKRTPF